MLLFVLIRVELRPAALKETPHGVSSHSHLRRVFIEQLAVVEDEVSICCKLLTAAVPSLKQSFSHGEEVHGVLDDAAVAWNQSGVDGFKEWPGIGMRFHLH